MVHHQRPTKSRPVVCGPAEQAEREQLTSLLLAAIADDRPVTEDDESTLRTMTLEELRQDGEIEVERLVREGRLRRTTESLK